MNAPGARAASLNQIAGQRSRLLRCPEALSPAAGRIAERIHNERHRRRNAVIFEPRPGAVPVPSKCRSAGGRAGRAYRPRRGSRQGLANVLGVGDGRPAEDHQDPDEDVSPGDCPGLHRHFFSFLFGYQTSLSGSRRIAPALFLPKAKSSQECIGVVTRSATWR